MGFVRYGKFKERHNIEVMVFRKRETGKLHRLLLLKADIGPVRTRDGICPVLSGIFEVDWTPVFRLSWALVFT